MSTNKSEFSRRNFFKVSSLSAIPFLLPCAGFNELDQSNTVNSTSQPINFWAAGLMLSPDEYMEVLNKVHKTNPVAADVYGSGGVTKDLEDAFVLQTQKEAAIYMPSGTMANELAIKTLNGTNTKVIVPDNSHIFRDEADAAQSVHNLRLVPIGKEKSYLNLDDLKRSIEQLNKNEVFKSGIGTVSIESPVRRASQVVVPIRTIKEISTYCRNNGLKLHLDGSRLHLAAAFTKISIAEYSSYFDTVYMSLYKCLNASGGAILCGEKKVIDVMNHQIKILGGAVFRSWVNTAVALHYMKDIEARFAKVRANGLKFIERLNQMEGVNIQPIPDGSFVFRMDLSQSIDPNRLHSTLASKHNMQIRNTGGHTIPLAINEGILFRDLDEIVDNWKDSLKASAK